MNFARLTVIMHRLLRHHTVTINVESEWESGWCPQCRRFFPAPAGEASPPPRETQGARCDGSGFVCGDQLCRGPCCSPLRPDSEDSTK